MKERLSGLIVGITYLLLVFLTFWGIGWSFYRHSKFDGFMAMGVPPYAWYRGVAAIWEEPKWKEQYEDRTEIIGILILADFSSSDARRSTDVSKLEKGAREWIETVPNEDRSILKEAASALAEARLACFRNVASSIITNTDPCSGLDLQSLETRISVIPMLDNVWKKHRREIFEMVELLAAEASAKSVGLSEADLRAGAGGAISKNAIAAKKLEADLADLIRRLFADASES